jgi:hypothetical protein
MLALSYKVNNQLKEKEELLDLIASVDPEKAAAIRNSIDGDPKALPIERREQMFAMCFGALANL